MRYRSMGVTRSGDLRSRTMAGSGDPRRTNGTTAGSGDPRRTNGTTALLWQGLLTLPPEQTYGRGRRRGQETLAEQTGRRRGQETLAEQEVTTPEAIASPHFKTAPVAARRTRCPCRRPG